MSAIARRRLPTTSGLASLRKPICVSLICTKVSAFFAAAVGVPSLVAPSARGTPPATVQTTAAPVQLARQLNALRRVRVWPSPEGSFALIEVPRGDGGMPVPVYIHKRIGLFPLREEHVYCGMSSGTNYVR